MTTRLQPLTGIVPPLVTPLAAPDRLDHAGLERLIEHVLAGGVHGLFLLGTTGEAPSLAYKQRCELIERACQQVAGRVPVLVGITDTSFQESVFIAEQAADAGANAVVLAPPYYFPAGQNDLFASVARLAQAVPLPLFLYNMPSHTKISFELETVRRLMDIDNIVGIKDSSGQMVYFHKLRELIARREGFSLLMGPEELLADAVLFGAHGGVCGGANLAPRLYVDLYEAAATENLPEARQLLQIVLRLSSSIYTVGDSQSSYLKGLKCALSLVGLCADSLAEPFQAFTGVQREQIARALDELPADYVPRLAAATPS